MESTTLYVKGRGEGQGTERQWWALMAVTVLITVHQGWCWVLVTVCQG